MGMVANCAAVSSDIVSGGVSVAREVEMPAHLPSGW